MASTYQGRPCKRCGGTLRYTSAQCCVACKKAQANSIPYEKRKAAARKSELKAKYGVDPDWYEKKLEEQGGTCGNPDCDRKPEAKALAVDHSHTTGAVRGLLCSQCNTALGQLGDSLDRIIGLHFYLTTYTAVTP